MKTIRAKFIMRKKVSIRIDASGEEVVYKIMASGYHGLPVVNNRREVEGIITEFNILKAVRDGVDLNQLTANKIMTSPPMTADIETTADMLINMMIDNGYTIIPILKDNKYVGVVSRHEILDAYVEPLFFHYFEEEE